MTDASAIREHMEVIGADGVHVATVDRVDGRRIKLIKADSGAQVDGAEGAHSGHHHYLPLGLVAGVEGNQVRLSATGANALSFEEEEGDLRTAIRPFRIDIPQAELDDMRRRILATRLPERETVPDQTQGVQLATVEALAEYWGTEYDWRRCEAQLNALPNFITEIDGLDIHFIHVRSRHENALPVVITHGWPGSVVEQLKIVGPLTDPTAYGGTAEDAFDVVIPSMPGYGFSGRPTETGWDPPHIARAFTELMKRLGYSRFVAQGGDWGAAVVDQMGVQAPPELLGIHTNMAGIFPRDVDAALFAGGLVPTGLSDEERRACEQASFVYRKGIGYAFQLGLRPQSMVALADSPVGLATYLVDHDAASLRHISELFVAGTPYGAITRDDILDNITLTYLANKGVSSGRLYWENKDSFFAVKGVTVPTAVSVFPEELYQAPRSWTEQAYPNLIHYNRLPKGGHFAAWEQPELLTQEIRDGFRSLR
jgi:pimeloyl-ACP methyl ester carboxylesterase